MPEKIRGLLAMRVKSGISSISGCLKVMPERWYFFWHKGSNPFLNRKFRVEASRARMPAVSKNGIDTSRGPFTRVLNLNRDRIQRISGSRPGRTAARKMGLWPQVSSMTLDQLKRWVYQEVPV